MKPHIHSHCAVLLLTSLLALPSIAQAQFEFEVVNGAVTITRYTGPGGDVVIPDTISGLPVACIGSYWVGLGGKRGAFDDCTSLTSIFIPSTVTSLEWGSFWGCTSLTEMYFAGNAPSVSLWLVGVVRVSIYYLPWTTGWGPTYGGRPTTPWKPTDWLTMLVENPVLRNPKPLRASLSAAQASIERGNLGAAANQLRAFQKKVRAQVANEALAQDLIEAAQQVIESL